MERKVKLSWNVEYTKSEIKKLIKHMKHRRVFYGILWIFLAVVLGCVLTFALFNCKGIIKRVSFLTVFGGVFIFLIWSWGYLEKEYKETQRQLKEMFRMIKC